MKATGITTLNLPPAAKALCVLRVGRAVDNAAGRVIADKIRAPIQGLIQGARNAKDGG